MLRGIAAKVMKEVAETSGKVALITSTSAVRLSLPPEPKEKKDKSYELQKQAVREVLEEAGVIK
jgi:hypothetical protein